MLLLLKPVRHHLQPANVSRKMTLAMETIKTALRISLGRHCPGRKISSCCLVLSLCVAVIASNDPLSSIPTNNSNADHSSSDVPDVTYVSMPDRTPPPELDNSLLGETYYLDSQTTPALKLLTMSTTPISTVQLSTKISTLQPQIIAKRTTTKASFLDNALTNTAARETTTKKQMLASQVVVTAETSAESPTSAASYLTTTSYVLTTRELFTTSSMSLSRTWPTEAATSSRYCYENRSEVFTSSCLPCSLPDEFFCPSEYKRVAATICGQGSCQVDCERQYQYTVCCHGYWGENCNVCPGGQETPCNDHGECQTENGTCICQEGFTGTACEICYNGKKYGLNCSQDCLCVNGICSNTVYGDGTCDCDFGFEGENCETDVEQCKYLPCYHGNDTKWRCVAAHGTATCICSDGYEFSPDLKDCIGRNPCNDPVYPCGNNSRCEQTGPGQHKCTCEDNYTGDGIVCLPIDPCQMNNGGCEQFTTCIYKGPNKHACVCNPGYEKYIPGIGCSFANACTANSCDRNANCQPVGLSKVRCTCKEGYIGTGSVCYGNIVQRISDINNRDPRFSQDLLYAMNLINQFYFEPLSKHGPFTLFVPNDRAFREVIKTNKGFSNFLKDEDRAMQILRQHILIGRFSLDDLQSFDTFYTLQGNAAQLQIRVSKDIFRYKLQGGSDRAKILAKDIVASNGMIHIVNNLLTLEPEITGDKQKTALDLIKLEGKYNRFQTLIMSSGLADVFTQPNITVFAPENGAWDSLPVGTLDYLMKDQEGQEKLKVILKNHVFPGVIGVTHLINTPHMKSFANVEVKITVSNLGQIQLDGKINVAQVNIPCSTGLYHHVEGVIVPSYIEEILPNKCADVMVKNVKGPCVVCDKSKPACPMSTDIPTDERIPCRRIIFWTPETAQYCSTICKREVKVPKCCPGFYGSDCLSCPGGFRNPCNGRGECSDGLTGTGLCFCEMDFVGTACDQCRQKDMFGPNCTESCTCLYGQCDDGPKGTGLCKQGSCQQGYVGDNCDKKLIPCHGYEVICHAHAKCFLNGTVASCKCEIGYEGEGRECKEVDPCAKSENGGCHQQATCTKLGPGVSRCDCNTGWFGDGFYCSPKTPCQEHSDCAANAKCLMSAPGEYHCACKVGYKGDGITCDVINLCVDNNGGCHSRAICTPMRAGERSCTCPENFRGDGVTCYGTIADEVMIHPNLTQLAELLKVVRKPNNLLNNVNSRLTLFAPSDAAIETFMASFNTGNNTSYWQDEENVVWFLNFHTLDNDYATEDLLALDRMIVSYPTLYDGFSLHIVKINDVLRVFVNHSEFATLAQPSMETMNGYIHLIDTVLEPFLPTNEVPTLNETLSSQPQYKLFYEALQITGVLDQVQDMNEFTVFVPTNDAIKQLGKTGSSEFIKYYIIPKLVFTPSIEDNDMYETMLGSNYKLLMSVSQTTIKVNSATITKPDILLDGGVLHEIDGVLHPVLNRCDYVNESIQLSECEDCKINMSCPDGHHPYSPPRIIKYECSFQRYPDAGWRTLGCRQICSRNISRPECCGGYFGEYCKECPGGAENPCTGNGRCYDGLKGNGTCVCKEGFSGSDCGKCEDPNLAPPYCNVTFNSCGYRNGNCSEHAICTEMSSGISCRCALGYVGDGYTCRSQCDILDNGGCHSKADCVFNVSMRAVQCTCSQGYHGNGTWCEENINPCASENGGCNLERGNCTFTEPEVTDMLQGGAYCECKENYVGDGKLCIGDIMDAISTLPDLRYIYTRLQENVKLIDPNVTQILSDNEATSTLFLPVSNEWQTLDFADLVVEGGEYLLPTYPRRNEDDSGSVEEGSTHNHFLEQLISLNGQIINLTVNSRQQIFANDVRIVQANIKTTNGILHLTEVPIVSYESLRVGASRDKDNGGSNSHSTVVIACAVVAVGVILIMMIAGVIYIKKHHEGFLKIFKCSQNNSESNISFARLNAQEEEDDAFKAPDNARYDNPIFNDPNLL